MINVALAGCGKVIAASTMYCGVLILYLPLTAHPSATFTLATLAGMAVALFVTRHEAAMVNQ